MSNPNHSETTNPAIPTAAQLAEARQKQWHQRGEALLTLENLRSWINAAGLVLFAPRPQIVAAAPSLVEAVLGEANASPTVEQTGAARSLLARLVAEGLAVPLNLLGAANGAVGDTPDFVASTAVFSYVFTLRGDKAWKQGPATTGALKVSHLALAAHEALAQRGAMPVYDLTSELGKEVTEAAVLRALAELWTHLRVLPLLQPDGRPALWELASARFTKQIKAGANAGQPSALSALISLYLGQAVAAAEEEIESFLSPLAARSRIRDVIHTLLSARQLDSLAVEGRTMLHVAGDLPAFVAPEQGMEAEAVEAVAGGEDAGGAEVAEAVEPGAGGATPRITKYVPKPRKIGTGYLAKGRPAKFAAKPSTKAGPDGARGGFKAEFKTGPRAGFKPRADLGMGPDRERRPFSKAAFGPGRGFDKPWEEEKARRLAAAAKPSDGDAAVELAASGTNQEARAEARMQTSAPDTFQPREGSGDRRGSERAPGVGSKPAFGAKRAFGIKPTSSRGEAGFGRRAASGEEAGLRDKPKFGSGPGFGARPTIRGKPAFGGRVADGDARAPRREFSPRAEGDTSEARPPRKTFSKPGTFGRKREGFGGKPSFGDARPPRRDYAPRREGVERPARGEGRGFGGARAPGSDAPGLRGDRPGRSEGRGFAPHKPYSSGGASFKGKAGFSGEAAFRGKPGFGGRPGFAQDRSDRAAHAPRDRPERGLSTEGGKRVYPKFDARKSGGPRERPARTFSSERPVRGEGSGQTREPAGDFAPRKFAGKPAGRPGGFAGKPGSSFAGKKRYDKPGGSFPGKPSSTFAKFADNRKPFGKRPPARKFKPKEDGSA